MPQWVEIGAQTITVGVEGEGEQPPIQPPIEEQETNIAALLGLFAAGALAFAVLKEREK